LAGLSKSLEQKLIAEGAIDSDTLELAIEQCNNTGGDLIDHLISESFIDAKSLASAISAEYSVPVYDVSCHNVELIPADVVDQKLVKKHKALPLYRRGNKIFVALGDPTNQQAITDIRFQTGLTVEAVIAEIDKLDIAIENFFKAQEEDIGDSLGDDGGELGDLDIEAVDEEGGGDDSGAAGADEAPIVKFVNKILLDAIKTGASDIHFEPYEKSYRVRMRVDGLLREVIRPPANLAGRLAARLKVMSRMDISERRVPQDGRIKLKLSKTKAIDFRVNTLPTLFGEKIVLRILDPTSAQLGIDALGYEDFQKDIFMDALHQPQGMILITGPTGSGKTVSLYTGLNILNTPERNISTAEDPVEINLEGINQVHVSSNVGLTFAEALRSFLRQDPDIVMVGEIRDLETAEIAIKAAQTGHLVLSTLHTNSAPETLTRLINMGVPAFNIASSVSIIIAQRLARRLCPACKEPAELPDKILKEEGLLDVGFPREEMEVFKPVGCPQCGGSGSKGRCGVYEVVKITPAIAAMIMEGKNSLEIAHQCKEEGFNNLRDSALRKVCMGLISLEEANRVTKD
jgi:type IV pilus assembly protein PilB